MNDIEVLVIQTYLYVDLQRILDAELRTQLQRFLDATFPMVDVEVLVIGIVCYDDDENHQTNVRWSLRHNLESYKRRKIEQILGHKM